MSDPELIKWFADVLHYPFDIGFDIPPPIDHDQLADYYNESDNWAVTQSEARTMIRAEAGLSYGSPGNG